jgi:hypothetical protein
MVWVGLARFMVVDTTSYILSLPCLSPAPSTAKIFNSFICIAHMRPRQASLLVRINHEDYYSHAHGLIMLMPMLMLTLRRCVSSRAIFGTPIFLLGKQHTGFGLGSG